MEATKVYIGILDAYGLSEDQLPLVKTTRRLNPHPHPNHRRAHHRAHLRLSRAA